MAKNKNTRKMGIKWKMFAILLVFIVVVIAVIWFFQVGMLEVFYRYAKLNELETTADRIEHSIGDTEELEGVVYNSAEEYYSSIIIFGVRNGVAYPVLEAVHPTSSVMTFFSKKDMQKLYDMASENGGRYVGTVSHNVKDDRGFRVEFFEYDRSDFWVMDYNSRSAVNVRICINNGSEFIIIQSSELSPVAATVRTLNAQFLWIGIILALLALALTGIISKLITKPIIKMNEAAHRLALGRYNADFEGEGYREIYELSRTLNYASSELAKTDKFQKELISNVSHDLRTPLTMIKGYAEVIRDIPGENTPENVQVIIDETGRLTELVNDMLDVSKLQAGTREPDMQMFSLTQIVSDVMKRYEKLTEQDGYSIDFIADEDVYVYADSVMMLQVVYNLINNAINYTGDDKVVTVRQTVKDNKVRISVTDTGAGIKREDVPLIWERYYKVDKVHKRAAVGTGLGLSITREILTLHNAEFGVSSTQGVGSTFWFELDMIGREFYEE